MSNRSIDGTTEAMSCFTSSSLKGLTIGSKRSEVLARLGAPDAWEDADTAFESQIWEYEDEETDNSIQVVFGDAEDVTSLFLSLGAESMTSRPVRLNECFEHLKSVGVEATLSQRGHAHYVVFGDIMATFLSVVYSAEGDEIHVGNPVLSLMRVGEGSVAD